MRFSPPKVAWSPAHQWVVSTALGPVFQVVPDQASVDDLVDAAERLGLRERIGGRWRRELGSASSDLAAKMNSSSIEAEAKALLLDQAAELIEEELALVQGQGLLLKGMALRRLGMTPPGVRRLIDVDVLLPREHASLLHERLRSLGFSSPPGGTIGHHLPPLASDAHGVIELHTEVPGIPAATTLLDNRQSTLALPPSSFLAAHALVHAWVQEGHSSGFRVFGALGDLIDLDANTPLAPLWTEIGEWAPSLDEPEIAAFRSLVECFTSGEAHNFLSTLGSNARTVLDHALAQVTDADYGWTLRTAGLSRKGPLGGGWRAWWRLLWPESWRLEQYWPAGSRFLPLRLRWWFHLAASGLRFLYGWARLKLRRS